MICHLSFASVSKCRYLPLCLNIDVSQQKNPVVGIVSSVVSHSVIHALFATLKQSSCSKIHFLGGYRQGAGGQEVDEIEKLGFK